MGIPKQNYALIEVTKYGMFESDPVKCDDCGQTIFNKVTIEGEEDGKTYVIGLQCAKKLFNKVITFELEDQWELERQEYLFDQAERDRRRICKYIDKYGEKFKYLVIREFGSSFRVEGYGEMEFNHVTKPDVLLFSTRDLNRRFLPFFKNFKYEKR